MLMGIMIVSAGILVSAKDEMGMVVNGENANMKISPKVIEGVTMVPFRETMETLQAKITWDADTKSIKAVRKNKSVSIQVGNNVIKVGNQDVELPSSPVVVDNVTYVPLRVISTGFGCKIRYDAINNNIVITDTALAKMTTTTKMTHGLVKDDRFGLGLSLSGGLFFRLLFLRHATALLMMPHDLMIPMIPAIAIPPIPMLLA